MGFIATPPLANPARAIPSNEQIILNPGNWFDCYECIDIKPGDSGAVLDIDVPVTGNWQYMDSAGTQPPLHLLFPVGSLLRQFWVGRPGIGKLVQVQIGGWLKAV